MHLTLSHSLSVASERCKQTNFHQTDTTLGDQPKYKQLRKSSEKSSFFGFDACRGENDDVQYSTVLYVPSTPQWPFMMMRRKRQRYICDPMYEIHSLWCVWYVVLHLDCAAWLDCKCLCHGTTVFRIPLRSRDFQMNIYLYKFITTHISHIYFGWRCVSLCY
jgi:hypothetical protein